MVTQKSGYGNGKETAGTPPFGLQRSRFMLFTECTLPFLANLLLWNRVQHTVDFTSTTDILILTDSPCITSKAVAAFVPYKEGKIVFLPHPFYEDDYLTSEEWKEFGNEYLNRLFCALKTKRGQIVAIAA